MELTERDLSDRQIDVLTGLCRGLTAKGWIEQSEVNVLFAWVVHSRASVNNPLINELFHVIEPLLDGGQCTEDDRLAVLFGLLSRFVGTVHDVGEVLSPTLFPVSNPQPPVTFSDQVFVFTGKFSYGTRKECQKAVEKMGGVVSDKVDWKTDYLVIGRYVSEQWRYEHFGNKIWSAICRVKTKKGYVSIITEDHWIKHIKP